MPVSIHSKDDQLRFCHQHMVGQMKHVVFSSKGRLCAGESFLPDQSKFCWKKAYDLFQTTENDMRT